MEIPNSLVWVMGSCSGVKIYCEEDLREEIASRFTEVFNKEYVEMMKTMNYIEEDDENSDHDPVIEFEGKAFVYTGFDSREEREIERIVTSRGGIIKSSVSKKVDYLIVNGGDGYGTRKYNYAIELKESGKKDITIVNGEEFFRIAEK